MGNPVAGLSAASVAVWRANVPATISGIGSKGGGRLICDDVKGIHAPRAHRVAALARNGWLCGIGDGQLDRKPDDEHRRHQGHSAVGLYVGDYVRAAVLRGTDRASHLPIRTALCVFGTGDDWF